MIDIDFILAPGEFRETIHLGGKFAVASGDESIARVVLDPAEPAHYFLLGAGVGETTLILEDDSDGTRHELRVAVKAPPST